jgi:hypothetical protein
MDKNAGTADRAVRIVAGLAILGLYFVVEPAYRWWAWWAGARRTRCWAYAPAKPTSSEPAG